MTSADRRQREKGELRQKILDAARELFAAEGYDAVTMRKVAERIDYSATAIYSYFADKDTLVNELCRQDFDALAQAFVKIARVADPLERLRKAGHAYVAFAIEHPQHYRLMFMTPHPHHVTAEDLAKKGDPQRDAYAFVKFCITEAIAAGKLAPAYRDPDLVAQLVWAAVHGLVALHLTLANDPFVDWRPLKKSATAMIDVVLRGLT